MSLNNGNLTEQTVMTIKAGVKELLQKHGIDQYVLLMSDGVLLAQDGEFEDNTFLSAISDSITGLMNETCLMLPTSSSQLN